MGRPPGKHCGDGFNRTPKSRHLQNTGDPTKNTREAQGEGFTPPHLPQPHGSHAAAANLHAAGPAWIVMEGLVPTHTNPHAPISREIKPQTTRTFHF